MLESGIAASSLSWTLVQPEVAKFTRVCSYDRLGLGWSSHRHEPVVLRSLVEELRGALVAAAIPRPIVMAAHSFGGLIARGYAAWYPEEIAGLVLVDPVLPSEWMHMTQDARRRLTLGIRLSRRGVWFARMGVVRVCLLLLASGLRAVPRLIGQLSSGDGSSVMGRLVGEVQKLPRELWPLIRSHWSDPRSFATMAAYLEALPAAARAVAEASIPSSIPITILSAAHASDDQKQEWEALALAAQLGQHIVAERSGHWIMFDEPELVVEAIRQSVLAASAKTASL